MFPVSAVGMLVRFDCVGDDQDAVDLQVSGLDISKGDLRCDSMGEQEFSAGFMNTAGQRALRKGVEATVAVKAPRHVRWSLSIDLVNDQATYDRLSGR